MKKIIFLIAILGLLCSLAFSQTDITTGNDVNKLIKNHSFQSGSETKADILFFFDNAALVAMTDRGDTY